MILDDLYRFYELKAKDSESNMPSYAWSSEKIYWEFRIDERGQLVSVLPCGDDDGNSAFVYMNVPLHETRSRSIKPYFLCDDATYFIDAATHKSHGSSKGKQEKFLKSKQLHHECLDGVDDDAARALLAFFDSGGIKPESKLEYLSEACKGGLIVFRFLPDKTFIHERISMAHIWQERYSNEVNQRKCVQCAITGTKDAKSANLFLQLTGFPKAQSAGASLVSFNNNAFCSYGKTKDDGAFNASISDIAAFNVGSALRYLMQSPKHHISFGDSQILYWTDAYEEEASEFFELLFGTPSSKTRKEDERLLLELQQRLSDIRGGRKSVLVDASTKYYLLCLAPNAARLSVRFFETGTFGSLEEAFAQYLRDIEIINRDGATSDDPTKSVRAYVYQTAAFGKAENVPETLVSSVVECLVKNRPFPQALFTMLLLRTRADKGFSGEKDKPYDAMRMRAAMFKACFLRRARQNGNTNIERSLTVALNETNENIGYLLGRLFAVLEKVQSEAISGANTTIRDRYIGAASSTPARVFPQLLKMAQHHISKAEYGGVTDRRIEEITSHINSLAGFPATLSYDDQGQFFIGYYQQKADFYTSKNQDDANLMKEEK